jgi:aryl-alcohol dehydrogenase-like predicted oxidoreductase
VYQNRYWHDREFDTVGQLVSVAKRAGVDLVTLAIAWVLANKAITSAIVGASRPDQLDSSLEAAQYVLDDELKALLDELTHEYRMGDAPR